MSERERLMDALWIAIGDPQTVLRREAFEALAASIIETYLGLPQDALAEAAARADRWATASRKLIEERDRLRSDLRESRRWARHYRLLHKGENDSDVRDWEEDPDWLEELR